MSLHLLPAHVWLLNSSVNRACAARVNCLTSDSFAGFCLCLLNVLKEAPCTVLYLYTALPFRNLFEFYDYMISKNCPSYAHFCQPPWYLVLIMGTTSCLSCHLKRTNRMLIICLTATGTTYHSLLKLEVNNFTLCIPLTLLILLSPLS